MPGGHSYEQQAKRRAQQITALERRLGVPARLSRLGEQVTDWDYVWDNGFFWSYVGGTLNAPSAAWWKGIVQNFGNLNEGDGTDNRRTTQTLTPGDPQAHSHLGTMRRVGIPGLDTWSDWVRIDPVDGPWTDIPLQPGIVRWDSGRTPQYRVLANGDVQLSGLVKPETGNFTGKVHLANLPAPLASNTQSVIGLTGVTSFGRLNAASSGHLETDFGTNSFGYVFLDNILLRGA